MTWVRLDDHFPDHPKLQALGDDYDAGLCLQVRGMCYCASNLTDGFIPARVFRHESKLAARLVDVGLWETAAGGWIVHDYLDYSPSRSKVEAERTSRQERGRMGAAARWDSSSHSSSYEPSMPSAIDMSDAPQPPPVPVPEGDNPTPNPAAADDVEQVRSAAGNKVTPSEASELLEKYGKERTLLTIRAVLAKPPADGIKNMAKLAAYRLEHGDGEPVVIAPPGRRRVSCPKCGGSGREFDPDTGEDTDIYCSMCLGDRLVDA